MGWLFETVRRAIADNRFIVTVHASNQLETRRISEWQVVMGTLESKLIRERPDDEPWPSVEVSITLAAGTSAIAIWSWMERDNAARLVTVFFPRA
jgi:hypothetical protein